MNAHYPSEPDPPVTVETWNARRSPLAAPLYDGLHRLILSAYPNQDRPAPASGSGADNACADE